MSSRRVTGILAGAAVLTVAAVVWFRIAASPEPVGEDAAAQDPELAETRAEAPARVGYGESDAAEVVADELAVPQVDGNERTVVATPTPEPEADEPASFTFHGLVRSGAPLSDASVEYGTAVGDQRTLLGSVDVQADATFGPETLTLDEEATDCWFRLTGENWAVEEIRLPRPAPDADVLVEFEGVQGEAMWFYVYDEHTGEITEDATVRVTWKNDGKTISAEGEQRPDGYVLVKGCLPGTVHAHIEAPGYATEEQTHVIPPPEPTGYAVGLRRTGRLLGRVLDASEPVHDFRVTISPFDQTDTWRSESFAGREDGSFAIDDAPSGQLQVLAFTRDGRQTATKIVEVTSETPTEVTLELDELCRARGRVVAQATGQPVVGARVRLFASLRGRDAAEPIGPAIDVDPDGSFELAGAFLGETGYEVTAPGYSEVAGRAVCGPDGHVDLGTIAIVPKQPLLIRLESVHGADPTQYVVTSRRGIRVPPTRFPASGEIRIDAMSIGELLLRVDMPDRSELFVNRVLRSGSDWVTVIPVDGSCGLTVELEGGPAEEDELDLGLRVIQTLADGVSLERAIWMREPFTDLSLPCGQYVLRVDGSAGEVLAKQTIDVEDSDDRIVLSLGLSSFFVHVVDTRGGAVTGARVVVGNPADERHPFRVTDGTGTAQFPSVGAAELIAAVLHPSLGAQKDIPITLRGTPEEEVEIVLDAPASVEAIVTDGEHPLPNVECTLSDAVLEIGMGGEIQTSDDRGYVRFDRLGEGTYEITAMRAGYRPTRELIKTSAREPLVIHMERDESDSR